MKSSAAGMAGAPSSRLRALVPGALVVGATVVAYLPALSGRFIWNDSDYVTAPALRSLRGLARIWTEPGATEQYYPLLHSAFWIQHRLWGDHPLGYHLVTVLLHAACAVLFALILRRLLDAKRAQQDCAPTRLVDSDRAQPLGCARRPGRVEGTDCAPAGTSAAGSRRGAVLLRPQDSGPLAEDHGRRRYLGAEWLAALLFALHPVHVESVAWITEQKNTLSLAFYLAAVLVYLRFDETRRPGSHLAALGLFVASLGCKTVTATLPAALLVILWWKHGRLDWRRDVQPLLPWLALAAAAALFSSWVEQVFLGARGEDFDLPLLARGLVAGRAIWFYAGKLVWPFGLNFVYPRWTPDPAVWWQWLFPLGVLAAGAALWLRRRRTRGPLAAFLFFAGSLFPVLGFVNLYGARYSWVWDHWQYLPDLGPLALAAAGLTAAWRGAAGRLRGWGPGLAAALAVLLGTLTWRRCGEFHDDQTLYLATLARNPGCWMAHNNLGYLLSKLPGRLNEAIAHYEEALRLNPDDAEAHVNLGRAWTRMPGRMNDAIAQFQEALRVRPDYAEAHDNLGVAWAQMPGRLHDAIAQFEEALRLRPDLAEVHANLGAAWAQVPGRLDDAIAEFRTALRLRPDLAPAWHNYGVLLYRMGKLPAAAAAFREEVRVSPNDPAARKALDAVLRQLEGR